MRLRILGMAALLCFTLAWAVAIESLAGVLPVWVLLLSVVVMAGSWVACGFAWGVITDSTDTGNPEARSRDKTQELSLGAGAGAKKSRGTDVRSEKGIDKEQRAMASTQTPYNPSADHRTGEDPKPAGRPEGRTTSI